MRRFAMPLIAVLLAASSVSLPALSHARQALLAWDRCLADGGTINKQFACDTDAGSDVIVVSFVPPEGLDQMNGLEVVIDMLTTRGTAWPSWWEFKNAGACRLGALSAQFDFTQGSSYGCEDVWRGHAQGGLTSFNIGVSNMPERMRFGMVAAVPPEFIRPVSPDSTYDAFTLTISHSKTMGADSCAGCSAPVCATITYMRWTQPVSVGDFEYSPNGESIVVWQSAVPECPAVVPARNRTWGAIKTLWR